MSADSLPHPLPQMALYPMRGGTLPAAAQRGLLPTGNCYWMPQRRTPITCPSPRSSQDPCSSEDDLTQSRVPHPHPWPATQLPVLEAGPGPRAPALNKQVTCSLFGVEAKNPALLSNGDGYLLELTGWTKGSQAS